MFRLLDLAIVRLDTYVEENYIYMYNVIQVITIKNCTSYGNTKYYKTTVIVSLSGGTRARLQQVGACV